MQKETFSLHTKQALANALKRAMEKSPLIRSPFPSFCGIAIFCEMGDVACRKNRNTEVRGVPES